MHVSLGGGLSPYPIPYHIDGTPLLFHIYTIFYIVLTYNI